MLQSDATKNCNNLKIRQKHHSIFVRESKLSTRCWWRSWTYDVLAVVMVYLNSLSKVVFKELS